MMRVKHKLHDEGNHVLVRKEMKKLAGEATVPYLVTLSWAAVLKDRGKKLEKERGGWR